VITKDSEHYFIDGKEYVRATTPLSILNRPSLVDWLTRNSQEVTEQWTEQTRDIGLEVHRLISEIIAGRSFSDTPAHILEWSQLDESIRNGLRCYEKARLTLDFEPIEAEKLLVSEEYGYAGTTDLLCEIHGDDWLLDWKVSSRLWPEVEYQLAAYWNAYREMTGRDMAGCRAIRLSRESGNWTPKDQLVMTPEKLAQKFEIYLCILKVWRDLNGSSR